MLIIFVLNLVSLLQSVTHYRHTSNLKKPHLFCYQDNKADPLHIGNESAFCKVVFLWKSKLKSPDLKE